MKKRNKSRKLNSFCYYSIILLGFFFQFYSKNNIKYIKNYRLMQARYKRQLTLSGLRNQAYWGAKFLSDWSLYLCVGILTIIIVAAFNTAFSGKALLAFVVTLLLAQVKIKCL